MALISVLWVFFTRTAWALLRISVEFRPLLHRILHRFDISGLRGTIKQFVGNRVGAPNDSTVSQQSTSDKGDRRGRTNDRG